MATTEEQLLASSLETNRLLRGGGGGGYSGGGGSSVSGMGGSISSAALSGLNSAAQSAVVGLGRLSSGTATAGDALGVFSSAISAIPGIGGTLGKIVQTLGEGVINVNNTMKETGKYGVTMGQNIGEFNSAVLGARMTMPEFQEQIRKNSLAISGLGSTMDRAAANYLTFTKGLQESKFVEQMKLAGVTAQEVSEIGLTSLANKRGVDMSTEKAQQDAMTAAIELAAQMNETSRITGKSREAMQSEVKARSESAVIKASIALLGPEAQAQYTNMTAKLAGLGSSVTDVADEITSGGIRTKEGAAKLAAMGPAAAVFQSAVKAQMNAKTVEEKKAASDQMDRAKLAITEYQRTTEFLEMVKTGVGSAADAARAQYTGNLEAASALAKKAEEATRLANATPGTPGAVPKTAAQLAAEQKAEVSVTKEAAPEAALSRTINAVDRTFKDVSAGIGLSTKEMNSNIANSSAAFKQLYTTGMLAPKSQEDTLKKGKEIVGLGPKGFGVAPSPTYTNAALPSTGIDASGNILPVDKTVKRATGSLGATGGLLEDFGKGTPAILHGKEGVVTEKQLTDIIGQAKDLGKLTTPEKEPGISRSDLTDIIGKVTDTGRNTNISTKELTESLAQSNSVNTDRQSTKKSKSEEPSGIFSIVSQLKELVNNVSATPLKDNPVPLSGPGLINYLSEHFSKNKSTVTIPQPPSIGEISSNIKSSLTTFANEQTSSKTQQLDKTTGGDNQVSNAENIKYSAGLSNESGQGIQEEMLKELTMLNTNITQLIQYSSDAVDASKNQVRATKSLSGNRFA
jgi:hypothetical protein